MARKERCGRRGTTWVTGEAVNAPQEKCDVKRSCGVRLRSSVSVKNKNEVGMLPGQVRAGRRRGSCHSGKRLCDRNIVDVNSDHNSKNLRVATGEEYGIYSYLDPTR